MDWPLIDKLVVAVSDVTTAVYLRMAFGGSRLLGVDGLPILGRHEVIISTDERGQCKILLRSGMVFRGRDLSPVAGGAAGVR